MDRRLPTAAVQQRRESIIHADHQLPHNAHVVNSRRSSFNAKKEWVHRVSDYDCRSDCDQFVTSGEKILSTHKTQLTTESIFKLARDPGGCRCVAVSASDGRKQEGR